ncbi:MAG TPA: RagB/SusD family nutrient uptake outer membrane protein [Puia sp.]
MNRINIRWFLALALLLGACKKQLNVYPTTQEVDGNIITDEKSAATALNGVYYRMAGGGADNNGVPSTMWNSLVEETSSQLSGMLSYTFGGGGLDEHKYKATDYSVGMLWSYGYALVNAANGFLKNIDPLTKITPAAKKQMIAEAKFLRAFGNTQLLLYYGQFYDTTSAYGIILHDAFVQPDNVYMSRSSVGASYDAILSDLDAAIPDLPAVSSSIAYANTWAGKLLEARVLINRGTAADYAKVVALAQDVIANGPFTLEGNVKDLFWTKGLSSSEVMLGVQPYSTQNIKWKDYIYYDSYGPNSFMDSLFNGDPRADWQIRTINSAYGSNVALTKYYPGSISNIAAAAVTENSYVFRLTEAYLLEAEAIVASGGSLNDAKGLLKTVMAHAGFTDFSGVDAAATAADLQLLIIGEEMKSFVAEGGQDWFALRRLPFATVQSLLPSIKDKSLLIFPIPDAEIISNNKIKQNPNY